VEFEMHVAAASATYHELQETKLQTDPQLDTMQWVGHDLIFTTGDKHSDFISEICYHGFTIGKWKSF